MQFAGSRLQVRVAGCRSEFGKRIKRPEWFTDLSRGPKTEHFNDVLVISYS